MVVGDWADSCAARARNHWSLILIILLLYFDDSCNALEQALKHAYLAWNHGLVRLRELVIGINYWKSLADIHNTRSA